MKERRVKDIEGEGRKGKEEKEEEGKRGKKKQKGRRGEKMGWGGEEERRRRGKRQKRKEKFGLEFEVLKIGIKDGFWECYDKVLSIGRFRSKLEQKK